VDPSDASATLRPRPLLEVLVRHDVRFIILGGVAERLLGSPRITDDFDICPATDATNLERLADVLNDVHARWMPPGLDEGFDPVEPWNAATFKAHTSLSLITPYGKFDIWIRPEGTRGFDELIENAVEVEVADIRTKVVHIEDSIRIKKRIADPKYESHIGLLEQLQRRRREQGLD